MDLITTRFRLPDVDERLAIEFASIKKEVMYDSQEHGTRNQPSLDCRCIKPFYERFHLRFQGLIDYVNKTVQRDATLHHVADHRDQTDHRLRDAHNKRGEIRRELDTILERIKVTPPPVVSPLNRYAIVVTTLLIVADTVLNIRCIESFGFGYLEAIVLSLMIAACLSITARYFRKIVSYGKQQWQRAGIGTAIFLLMITAAWYLARQRAELLNMELHDKTGQSYHTPIVPFILISILFFGVAVIVSNFLYLSPEKRAALRAHGELLEHRDSLEAEQANIERDILAIEAEHADVRMRSASLLNYAEFCEKIIMACAHEYLGLWKQQNGAFQKPNVRPPVLDTVGYPFQFQTYFQTIKQQEL